MEKFDNKYRIPSARLKTWDYGSTGRYFITICTKDRKSFFGEILNMKMLLNETGKIANQCWIDIPNHFKFVELGEHIVMPNHIHGIIILNNPKPVLSVETGHALSLPSPHNPSPHNPSQPSPHDPSPHFRFRDQGKNTISAIVGSFKSATTRLVKKIDNEFNWQTRFHDHIIRSEEAFVRISNYILNNPANWGKDKFNNNGKTG